MAEDPKDKVRQERRQIAQKQQRAKALLARKLSKRQRDRVLLILETLSDVQAKIAERDLYEKRGDKVLAEAQEPAIGRGLSSVEEDLASEEEAPEEESSDENEEGQPDNQQDDQQDSQQDDRSDQKRKDKRPQEREKKSRPENKSKINQPAKTKPTMPAKPPIKPPIPAGGAGAAGGARAGLAALVKTPHFWIAVAIIAAIILIIVLIMWLAGGAHKSFNESGGSIPIAMDYGSQADRDLVARVMALRDSGALVLANGTDKDVEWQADETTFTHKLDWRTMVTLKYLTEKWQARTSGVIGVSVLASNAPDSTRRMAATKYTGAAPDSGDNKEPLDAPSAYVTGQGIAIDTIGRVSNELAKACFRDDDGNQSNNAPVQVKWQEIASQEVIRPAYEQLQVDGKQVFTGLKVLQGLAKQAQKSPTELTRYTQALTATDSIYATTGTALDYMIINLQKIGSLNDKGVDVRTKAYALGALAKLTAVREATKSDVLAWDDEAKVIQPLRKGLEQTFRMMQVANMVGWKGTPSHPNCRLWKAYEARQNIRQLVLDLEQMPADPALAGESGGDWNVDLMVRQIIVYSPEDDLDNGLPDLDVFPKGAIAVDEGGVGYDDTGRDGTIDQKDNNFMAMPIDNGVFSKAATVFVYKTGAGGVALDLALAVGTLGVSRALDGMHDFFSGTNVVANLGESVQKVTYKNFVHIGF